MHISGRSTPTSPNNVGPFPPASRTGAIVKTISSTHPRLRNSCTVFPPSTYTILASSASRILSTSSIDVTILPPGGEFPGRACMVVLSTSNFLPGYGQSGTLIQTSKVFRPMTMKSTSAMCCSKVIADLDCGLYGGMWFPFGSGCVSHVISWFWRAMEPSRLVAEKTRDFQVRVVILFPCIDGIDWHNRGGGRRSQVPRSRRPGHCARG